jgi:hypothetical protein
VTLLGENSIPTSDAVDVDVICRIQTPQLSYNGNVCLRFAYSMFGTAINRFYVVKSSDPNNRILDVTGNQGESWLTAVIDLSISASDRVSPFHAKGGQLDIVLRRLFSTASVATPSKVTLPWMTSESVPDSVQVPNSFPIPIHCFDCCIMTDPHNVLLC